MRAGPAAGRCGRSGRWPAEQAVGCSGSPGPSGWAQRGPEGEERAAAFKATGQCEPWWERGASTRAPYNSRWEEARTPTNLQLSGCSLVFLNISHYLDPYASRLLPRLADKLLPRRRALATRKRSSEALLWSLTHANEREPIVGADACAAPSGHHAPPAIRHLPALSNTPCSGAWRLGHCWLNLRSAPRPQKIPLPREVRGQAFRAHRGCGSHVERGHSSSGAVDRQHLHEGATTARLQFAADRGAARTHARTCTDPPLSTQASTLRSTRSTQSRMSSARMRSSCGGRAR